MSFNIPYVNSARAAPRQFGSRVLTCARGQEFNRDDPASSNPEPIRRFNMDPACKCTRAAFVNYKGDLDGGVLLTLADGRVQIIDPNDGDVLEEEQIHSKQINRISFNKEKTLLFTASADCLAKMVDAESLEVLKVYTTDRPVNAIVAHPTKDHVLLGGGQDAMSVTTTAGRVGKFECRFFEAFYNREFGRVKGHFGPINAIAINPDGRSYASGAEDGYIRLHHFDQDYIEMADPVPTEEIKDEELKEDIKAEE
jgi:translation initiation factor 3 subunit I